MCITARITPQGHLQLLEGTAENQQALLLGLEYLVNISYVDNIEVRVTHLWGGRGFAGQG